MVFFFQKQPVFSADIPKDYYQILGVSPQASQNEIRTAFRKLALIYHPDRASGVHEGVMKDLNEAHSVLLDPIRKAAYDRLYLSRRKVISPNGRPGRSELDHAKPMLEYLSSLSPKERIQSFLEASSGPADKRSFAISLLNEVDTVEDADQVGRWIQELITEKEVSQLSGKRIGKFLGQLIHEQMLRLETDPHSIQGAILLLSRFQEPESYLTLRRIELKLGVRKFKINWPYGDVSQMAKRAADRLEDGSPSLRNWDPSLVRCARTFSELIRVILIEK